MTKRYGVALAGMAVAVGLGVLASDGAVRQSIAETAASWSVTSGAWAEETNVLPVETVRETLAAMGYEVVSLELDDDEYEAYAMRDGLLWEVELDASTGQLLKVEYDVDDDDHEEVNAIQ